MKTFRCIDGIRNEMVGKFAWLETSPNDLRYIFMKSYIICYAIIM